MLFSVIIPIYNAENTLRRCLDSLASQAAGRAELILVNDGSTDGSDEICREYCSKYDNIHYIAQENGGPAAARNCGLREASGEFVSFVDSDDMVAGNYFDILSGGQDLDLLLFGAQVIQNGAVTGSILPKGLLSAKTYEDFSSEFIRSRNGSPCNKRFRRAIMERSGIEFPSDLRIGEDFVFCLRYLMCARSAKAVAQCTYIVDETNQQSNSRRYNADSCSQALLNYRYSFDAVMNSTLAPAQKNGLLQILDYNYYRTGFACVQELFKTELKRSERLHSTRDILSSFAENDRHIPPRNLTHRLTKFVVNRRLAHTAYAIAWIHNHT